MHTHSITQLSKLLHNKKISSVELTSYYLNRINTAKELNTFISIDEEEAFKQAKAADKHFNTKQASMLTGIPFAHKDNICTKNRLTTCASKILSSFKSPYDATLVKNLAEERPVMLGKTNMDEFAMGSSNESSYFGPVKNPWNLNHVPGGSSGGSAAAIAAGLIPFATGSDTGGSIRQPASFCGISGLKPTYGLVSRLGLIAYASSLDQAGPMAHSAEDLAIILQAMAGFDKHDSTSLNSKIPQYIDCINQPLLGLKIGFPSSFFNDDLDESIHHAILKAIEFFRHQGAQIIPIELNLSPYWTPCYYLIALAEASSNLARYDGMRFGYRTEQTNDWSSLIQETRTEGFGKEVKRRILAGTYFLSSAHHHDHYVHAQKVRRMIHDELIQTFSAVDIILGPTTPTPAFAFNERALDSIKAYSSDRFTVAANLSGLPALSIPVGFHPKTQLPLGMQLMGPPCSEARLLNVAHRYQLETSWHSTFPLLKGLS